jgi:hypothetical protein
MSHILANCIALFCFKSLFMTQKKYLLILFLWMFSLSGALKAQHAIPVKLKTGDWFSIQYQTKMRSRVLNLDNSYAITYRLTHQEPSGHRIYKVTVDRTIIRQWLMTNPILGYDSYYPPYVQNQAAVPAKAYFLVKTDYNDKIIQVTVTGKIPRAMLTEIILKRNSMNLTGEQNAYGTDIVNTVTTEILNSIRLGKSLVPHKKVNLQKGIVQEHSITLTGASFKTPSAERGGSITSSTNGEALVAFDSDFHSVFDTGQNDDATLTPEVIMQLQQKQNVRYKELINKYKNQLSAEAQSDYNLKKQYLQSKTKLLYLQEQHNLLYRIPSGQGAKRKPVPLQDFPKNFFSGLDTLTVAVPKEESSPAVSQYLNAFIRYNRSKLPMTNWAQSGFIADYTLSLACLKNYPLYNQLSAVLAAEITKGDWKSLARIKPYYDDFLNNCGDTVLTQALKKRWQKLEAWAPGNPNPLKEIVLTDGTKLDLQQFKGKIVCVLLNYTQPSNLDSYLEVIKKQNPDEVQFVIGQVLIDQFKNGNKKLAAEFAKLSNVKYVNISAGQPQQSIDINRFFIKGFVLDKKQDVVIDNVNQLFGSEYVLNTYIQKAYQADDMTAAEKSALIKTAIWTITSILLTALFVFFIQRSRMGTLKKNELAQRQIKELEIKAIRSQMNPHFIFNALNSIQSLNNNGQYKAANSYLEKFSVLMRNVLNNSEKSLVPLTDELKTLRVYCELEQLRFNFNFVIETDETVNEDLIELPGMIIQPLVENAIIHGLAQKGADGILKVRISIEGIYLKIRVTDNGPGFKADHTRPGGLGLKLVRERLDLLNADGSNGGLTINSNLTGTETGTTVILTIPID